MSKTGKWCDAPHEYDRCEIDFIFYVNVWSYLYLIYILFHNIITKIIFSEIRAVCLDGIMNTVYPDNNSHYFVLFLKCYLRFLLQPLHK